MVEEKQEKQEKPDDVILRPRNLTIKIDVQKILGQAAVQKLETQKKPVPFPEENE